MKKEVKEEAPQNETIEMKGQTGNEKPKAKLEPKLGNLIAAEFKNDYAGIFPPENMLNVSEATRQALIIDLLFAIYGELRLNRNILDKMQEEEN